MLSCPQCNSFLLHLGENNLEPSFYSFVLYGVSKAAAEVETQAKESILLTTVGLLRPEESVPLRFLGPSPVTSFSLAGGGVMTVICCSFCFGGFFLRLGGLSVALTGRFCCCSERGSRVAGRSHGPGCAAVSLIGAIQWGSL